jgi:uncharacterized protein YjbI with pentapeptide repeats
MSWPIVITLAAVSLVPALLRLWWSVPKWQMRSITAADPKARADIEDNFRKTIGQLIGGVAVLIGAGFAYLQFNQQQQTSQQQFSQQQQASRDLLISNQVSKGFEQLGSDKVVVRLGGIYALEGVMNTSEQYHQPVLEALSAFVRDSTRAATGDGPPATDIQAALTVIGRRASGIGGENALDLVHVQIPKADLGNAKLMGADLRGAILFSADLSNVRRLGDARLTAAKMHAADLTGAILTGANLSHAVVTQAQLDQACGTDVKLDPGLTIKPCP